MNKNGAFYPGIFFSDVVYGVLTNDQNNYKNEKGATSKMRQKWQHQMPLVEPTADHPQEMELDAISRILDATPTIAERVLQELTRGKEDKRRTGANGMSATAGDPGCHCHVSL